MTPINSGEVAMQTDNRILDDLARVLSGAVTAASGVREEVEARLRQQLEGVFERMDLVNREDFEVVRDMAALARQENERLSARVEALEARLEALESSKKIGGSSSSKRKKTSTTGTKKAQKAS